MKKTIFFEGKIIATSFAKQIFVGLSQLAKIPISRANPE